MALPAARMASWASKLATYAEGDQALELVPVGGGTGVPFVHDEERAEPELTEAGMLELPVLRVMCRTLLEASAQYTWGGYTWTVRDVHADYMGGAAWPHRVVLERHAA